MWVLDAPDADGRIATARRRAAAVLTTERA